MKTKQINQKGFGVMEVVLTLLLVGLVVAVGWYLLQRNDAGDNKEPVAASAEQANTKKKSYTDEIKLYTLRYPESWSAKEDADCCAEEKDSAQLSRGVTFAPADKADVHGYGVRVQGDKIGASAKNVEQNWKDNGHEPEVRTINGYSAKYVKVAFNGDAENYIDHQYLITHGEASMLVTFREKYYHQWPAEDWKAGSDLEIFNQILNSITFLK